MSTESGPAALPKVQKEDGMSCLQLIAMCSIAKHIVECVRILALFPTRSASANFSNVTLGLQNPVRHALLFEFLYAFVPLIFCQITTQTLTIPACTCVKELAKDLSPAIPKAEADEELSWPCLGSAFVQCVHTHAAHPRTCLSPKNVI